MAELTTAERKWLATEGMGWHEGKANKRTCYIDVTLLAKGAMCYVAEWLPDRDIKQAFELLMAMDAKEYAVRLEPFPRPGLGQYAVSFRKGRYVLDTDKVEVGPIAEAICRAVLAALEVK